MSNNLIYSSNPNKKAAFITEEGSFINLQENKVNIIGYADREVTHCDFYSFLIRHNLVKASNPSNICNELGLIRVNDGTYIYISEEAFIELPKKEPNKDQYDALLKWLDYLMLNSKKECVFVGFSSRGKSFPFVNKTHSEGLLPEQLINEIKKLYNKEEQEK